MRESAGTTAEQANQNFMLAESIVSGTDVQYAVYHMPGHGIVTLHKKKARAFFGNKQSHMRTPSAYKYKCKDKVPYVFYVHIYITILF